MGARLSRELGLYNEEEIILPIVPENERSTPSEPRYRTLRNDPRSATLGIVRTPIQVECTPPSNKTFQPPLKLIFDSNMSKESQNSVDEAAEVEEKTDEEPIKRYLETDIDAVKQNECHKFSPVINLPLLPLKHPRVTTLITDPRSPASFDVNRTPTQIECSPGMFSLCSRIDSASLDISDCVSDDPSAVVSEMDESQVPKQPEDFKDWFDGLESKISQLSMNTFVSSPKKTPNKFSDRNIMKKELFLTSDNKIPNNLKPRLPLGNVQNTQLVSPKNSIRSKQWRGIEEERSRRGVKLDDENTPPPLPPLSNISSAPGKLVRKRRITDWDKDATILI